MSDASSRNPTKRACDACKVRKVRCSNTTPCTGCVAIHTECTFNTTQGPRRGPRKLREKTIMQIAESQRQERNQPIAMIENLRRTPSAPAPAAISDGSVIPALDAPLPPLIASPPAGSPPSYIAASSSHGRATRTPVATLVLHLCVYRLRMFPVWPIVAVEDLMATLQKDNRDTEAYALANIIAAATIIQLRLDPLKNSAEVVTAESMEREAQRVRAMRQGSLTLSQLRIVFFLHVYYENLEPGGIQSLLYIREAITMAQIMDLHKESSYRDLSLDEQQFRKRVIWLLFITERAIAMLHKLPVVLKFNTSFPAMEYDQDVSILPAFRKLVNLYWIFEKSEALDIIQYSSSSNPSSTKQIDFSILHKRLDEILFNSSATNEVQISDICVTRTWMHTILWRIDMSRGITSVPDQQSTAIAYPAQTAKDFLDVVSELPTAAIEPHGPSMELKVYAIACSVIDSISRLESNESADSWEAFNSREVLNQLQAFLSSHRRGNAILIQRLKDRLAKIRAISQVPAESNPHFQDEMDDQNSSQSPRRQDQSDVSGMFGSHTEVQHDQNHNLGFSSGPGPDQSIGALVDFSQMPQQRFMPFSWDSMNEESQIDFNGNFQHTDSSGELDRFLGDRGDDGLGVMS